MHTKSYYVLLILIISLNGCTDRSPGNDKNASSKKGRTTTKISYKDQLKIVENKTSELRAAVKDGKKELIISLIKDGADVNARDENDCRPIHYAVQNGHSEIVEILIENRAIVYGGRNCKAPLLMAIEKSK